MKEVEEYLQKKKDKEKYIQMLKNLFYIVTCVLTLICASCLIIYRLKNPHLTQTELGIYTLTKYWWLYIMIAITYFRKR